MNRSTFQEQELHFSFMHSPIAEFGGKFLHFILYFITMRRAEPINLVIYHSKRPN